MTQIHSRSRTRALPKTMKTSKHTVSSPIPVASPQPLSRRKALATPGMLSAHILAGMKKHGFYLNIAGLRPELISSNEAIRIPLDALPFSQLQAVKNLAHDQYVRAMLSGDLEMETHRATLNFISRQLQKAAQAPVTASVAESRGPRRPNRSASRQNETSAASKAA